MSVQTDPRDAAIVALREALLEARSGKPLGAARVEAVLRETDAVAQEAERRVKANAEGEEISLLEWEGLGADAWHEELAGRDAQEYVNVLRDEWEERERDIRHGAFK